MRKTIFSLLLFFTAIAGVRSADIELDSELMHTIEDTNKNLAANIAGQDAAASTADARELDTLFVQVEDFFVKKGGAEDAVALSQKVRELSRDIVTAVAAKDFGGATHTATTLARTCKTCHNFYKKS